jgi:hypothetical protein
MAPALILIRQTDTNRTRQIVACKRNFRRVELSGLQLKVIDHDDIAYG